MILSLFFIQIIVEYRTQVILEEKKKRPRNTPDAFFI